MKRISVGVRLVALTLVLLLALTSCGGPSIRLRLVEDRMLGESYVITTTTSYASDTEWLDGALSKMTSTTVVTVDGRKNSVRTSAYEIVYADGVYYFNIYGLGSYAISLTDSEAGIIFGESEPPLSETPCERISISTANGAEVFDLIGIYHDGEDATADSLKTLLGAGKVSLESHDVTVVTCDRGYDTVRHKYVFDTDVSDAGDLITMTVESLYTYDAATVTVPTSAKNISFAELKDLLGIK